MSIGKCCVWWNEDCGDCDSDTENDDTLTPTRSRGTTRTAAAAVVQLDDIIDDDSDFEASSKPRRSSMTAAASQLNAKYCHLVESYLT